MELITLFKNFFYSIVVAIVGYFRIHFTHSLRPKPNPNKDYQINPIDFALIREVVEKVLRSKANNSVKIVQLKCIEKDHYKPWIHQLAYKETLEELKDLVVVLKDLGYLFTKLGEFSGELKYYTKAAVFYQYVITIMKEKLNEQILSTEDKHKFITQELIDPNQQLAHLQELIFLAIGGDQTKIPDIAKEIDNNKQLLSDSRDKTKQEMQTLDDYNQKTKNGNQEEKLKYQELYVKTGKELFEMIADHMKDFLAKLFRNAESELAKAPCAYAVVGLGSMALKQITRYSDLKFAILTENEDYKESKDPKIKEYFKNLSHLVNFKIINLGETIIPISQYGLDLSHLVHEAVNFDLGGITPLGRIGGDKPYELIKTVDLMMHYVRDYEDKASHIDKNLPHILENVCYVYGDEELVKEYKDKVTEFLHCKDENDPHKRLNCEIRALKLLKEGAVGIAYLQKSSDLKPKQISFKGDLKKLEPNLFDDNGRLFFDVKQGIYRLPDRMIYNLGLHYGIEGDSSWDTVDKLETKAIINPQAAMNLKNAITFATTLRLKTYLYYEAQKEDMSIFAGPAATESELKEQTKQIFHLDEADLGEKGGLFQYFYTVLPLHEILKGFCDHYQNLDIKSRQLFFNDNELYKDDYASKGSIYFGLAQFKEAQDNLEKALNDPHNKDNCQIKSNLGLIYVFSGNSDQAIKQYKECLDISKSKYGEFSDNVAVSLHNLGSVYTSNGQYDKAIYYHEESLKMIKLIHKDKPHPDVATYMNNLGNVYTAKGKYDKAIYHYDESFKMRKLIHKDDPHPYVATSLNNLGNVYQAKGEYDKAIYYNEESLKMIKLIHKDEPHSNVATYLNNLGKVYEAKGEYDKAIYYNEESLKMYKLIHKDKSHPNVAFSLSNLGNVYRAKEQYDKAIYYNEESLKINKLIYKDEPHSNVAISLNNLGVIYRDIGQYDKAIYYHEESLKIEKLIHKDKPHLTVTANLNNLGLVYEAQGQYDKAIYHYEESLKMSKLIHKDEPHPHVVSSLGNLGAIYRAKEQYDKAIYYHKKSLNINKLIHKDKPHPNVAISFYNLGKVYEAKGQYDEAIYNYKESLKMFKLFHKDEPHSNVASSLNSLANVYHAKRQYDKAIYYYEESLKIKKLIHKDEPHPNVATALNNLGNLYQAKGQYDKAIYHYEESLKMSKLFHKDVPHPNVATSLNNLAKVYHAKGQYNKAIYYHKESLKIQKLIH
jgi:tetratricopeptide (TPR) repeat protein